MQNVLYRGLRCLNGLNIVGQNIVGLNIVPRYIVGKLQKGVYKDAIVGVYKPLSSEILPYPAVESV